MEGIFYFFFGWLIGSGSGEEVVEAVTSVPEAGMEVTAEATQICACFFFYHRYDRCRSQ